MSLVSVSPPLVPTLLQHFSRAGLGRLQLNVRALPWAGWEEDGRKQDNSLFSGWIHPTFPSTHQDWGVDPRQNMCNIGPVWNMQNCRSWCQVSVFAMSTMIKVVPFPPLLSAGVYTSTCLGERIEEGGSDVYRSLLKISGENTELCHGTWALMLPAVGG